jgi:hypothetical protein
MKPSKHNREKQKERPREDCSHATNGLDDWTTKCHDVLGQVMTIKFYDTIGHL